MTYNAVTFVETSLFTRLIKNYLNDDEYLQIQRHLMEFPDAGSIISGSGGIRKLRWSRNGIGKSRGLRIIYYWNKSSSQLFMLTLYSKSECESIDNKALMKISKQLEEIK